MTVQKKSKWANHMLEFATVRYWQGQLNESGIKNSASNRTDTRLVYRTHSNRINDPEKRRHTQWIKSIH